MGKFKFSRKAVDDLSSIWNYTFNEWSESQAEKYYWMLIDTCKEISDNPDMGKDYSSIVKNLFGIASGHHIIFYRRLRTKDVEIVRILHEQMDLKSRIKE